MLKKKKIVKIFLFLLVLLGGVLLPNISFNAAISPNNQYNYVIILQSEDVEVNRSYVRILYYFDDDGYTLLSYANSDVVYTNNNVTSVNLLGREFTLYVVNAIISNNNIIISEIGDYETFSLIVNSNLYDDGYVNGYDNATNVSNDVAYNNGYNNGYNEGYNIGSNSGFDMGYNEGLTIGYNNGFLEGQTSNADNFSLLSLFSLILMYPFKVIALGMDVDIFGVNVGALIIGLLAIGLVIGIISIFRGGKNE